MHVSTYLFQIFSFDFIIERSNQNDILNGEYDFNKFYIKCTSSVFEKI